MTHAEMDELYDLYALGVLEPELAMEIQAHVADQCAYCAEHVQDALSTLAGLANIAPPVEPPRRLRARILASVSAPQRRRAWSLAVLALGTACAALILFSVWSGNELSRVRDELSSARRERNELRAAVELLTRTDTRTVEFGKSEGVPHGRVLVNRSGGLVFVGSRLPALASDKTFELWLIPANGVPKPAGLFRPDAAGNSVNVSSLPVSAGAKAVAVSVEPSAGSSAPTTTPILVVPLAS